MFGIVLGGSNNIFSVECEDSIIRQCTIKGKKLEASKGYYNPLAPGDEVEHPSWLQAGNILGTHSG